MNIIDQKLTSIVSRIKFSCEIPTNIETLNTFSNIKNIPIDIIRETIKQNNYICLNIISLLKSLLIISIITRTDYISPIIVFSESILAYTDINIEDLKNRLYLTLKPLQYGNLTSIIFKDVNSICDIEDNNKLGILPIFLILPIIIYGYNSPEWTLISVQTISNIIYKDSIISSITTTIAYILIQLISDNSKNKTFKTFKNKIIKILENWIDIYPNILEINNVLDRNKIYSIISEISLSKPDDTNINDIWNWKKPIFSKSMLANTYNIRKNYIQYINNSTFVDSIGKFTPDFLAITLNIIYNSNDYTAINNQFKKNKDYYHVNSLITILCSSYFGEIFYNKIKNNLPSNIDNNLLNEQITRVSDTVSVLYLKGKNISN